MRRWFQIQLARLFRWLQPARDLTPELNALRAVVSDLQADRKSDWLPANLERAAELFEARQMAGAGPWLAEGARGHPGGPGLAKRLREADPLLMQGATGDWDLALANVEWKREINLSWMEFSRWGIQQIILISRLYKLKNPIVNRLVNVCAAYVFARGVDVTTDDQDANATLDDFFKRNQRTLGHAALMAHEQSKDTDGNLFFTLFADKTNTGLVDLRTIDAAEIMNIVTNPEDADEPWYYHRIWTQRGFDPTTGAVNVEPMEAWYPALGFDPATRETAINGIPIRWESPVYHRKCGGVGKWLFGCPRIYPMLDWAKEARRWVESCASRLHALAQIAVSLTTKGGQAALAAQKQQLQTTVGPSANIWDTNPPSENAIFGSGPGTKLEAFNAKVGMLDVSGARELKLWCCMVKGVPETFLSDVSTGNLATATSLDRPTETVMLELQEEWVEDLVVIATYVLAVSKGAANGRLREALMARKSAPADVQIRECSRERKPSGGWRYVEAAKDPKSIRVRVEFPAIREGDTAAQVLSTVAAMTLQNKGGQVTGIDEKEGVKILFRLLDREDGDEITEKMYPDSEYEIDRTKEIIPPPIPRAQPVGGIQPQPAAAQTQGIKAKPTEALAAAAHRLTRALKLMETEDAAD